MSSTAPEITAPLPRRARHKARTRQALIDAALELFAEQGYEATTVEEITARASVSPRTFFRYFATKEQVLFFGSEEFIREVVEHLPTIPGNDDLAAVMVAFAAKAHRIEGIRSRITLYYSAVASSGVLLGRHAEQHASSRDQLAAAVADRRGRARPDAGCELVAELGLLILDRAVRRWSNGPSNRTLRSALARELQLLRSTVSSGG